MAVVIGTDGDDFIHVANDGRVPPSGYNDIPDLALVGNGITPGAGTDIVYGSPNGDTIHILERSHIDGLAEIIDGGEGFDFVSLEFNGAVDLSAATLLGIEQLSLDNGVDALEVFVTAEQLSSFSVVAGSGLDRVVLISAGAVTLTADFQRILNLGALVGSSGDDSFEIVATTQNNGLAIEGRGGDDTINFTSAGRHSKPYEYVLDGGGGNDKLVGTRSIFSLLGGGGQDRLVGGKQGDSLDGGRGRDVLIGGAGADSFLFTDLADSRLGKADRIDDFSHGAGDRIDLTGIDADTGLDGDQAFFLGGSVFTLAAGELIQSVNGDGDTVLRGDVNGDGLADFELLLTGGPVLTGGDFLF